ncbi:MAG: hypothetical protein RI544_02345 [Haloquadratum sp.]|jgi:hypothetical protein|nr:hypothetical protein [Haloferacaceae archaeon]MDR9444982.1 hypothetical protein [Haloquadratum sp.]
MVTRTSYTVHGPDATETAFELPAGLAGLFTEDGEDDTDVIADFVIQMFTQQAHAIMHHNAGETPEAFPEMNAEMETLFEERFGISIEEAMGHAH